VRELFARGVGGHHLGGVIRELRPRLRRWPLTRGDLATEELIDKASGERVRTLIVEAHGGGYWDFSPRGMQGFEETARQPLEAMVEVLKTGGWPSRELALHRIDIDPERLSGRPSLRGHRLPVEFIADLAGTPNGREELAEFDLSEAEIDEAVRWWETSLLALT
jgi:uncharacterized protein (DUF433 family)